jgi:hypothetical protein
MDPSTGRPAGDQRITPEGREILLRLITGDLMDEFPSSTASRTLTRSWATTAITTIAIEPGEGSPL